MNPTFSNSRVQTLSKGDHGSGAIRWMCDEDETAVRRGLVRQVAACCGLDEPEVEIVSRAGTKPWIEIAGGRSDQWQVSLSYTRGRVAGVVSFGRPVGIDLERVDAQFRWEPLAAEFFPSEIVAALQRHTADEARRKFFQHWVRFEAVLKCRGTGFRSWSRADPKEGGEDIFDLLIEEDYVGCVAVACPSFACSRTLRSQSR
jgi:hypothetical protein